MKLVSDPNFSLLQITALLLMPAMLGHSMGRALRIAPSAFSHFALSSYFRRQRPIDALWLVFAIGWFVFTVMRSGGAETLQVATGALLAGTVGGFLWTQRILVPRLGRTTSDSADSATEVAPVDTDGDFQRRHNAVDPATAICGARAMAAIHASLGVFAILIIFAITLRSGALAELVKTVVVVGLWLSLRVLAMDLAMDTWPGAGSESHLRRTFVYYVQMFEQWVVHGVLASIMIVMVVAPLASLAGYVPALTASFSSWAVVCMVVAIVWNKLHRAGRVATPLALPMQVSRYSARNPGWAYAVTIMHLGMVCCLLAGIAAVNGLLP